MSEFPNATRQEIIDQRGPSAHVIGVLLVDAVAAGYSIPPGQRVRTISDSRVGEAEARRMDELMSAIQGKGGKRRILSLFDGIGSTSSAIARAIPNATVIGVDNDPETHERGRHNIGQAGLSGRVTLVEADALEFLESAGDYDAIFADPLWPSRPEGYSTGTFSISETNPPLTDIFPRAAEHAPLVAARVPLIANIGEVFDLSRDHGRELIVDTLRIEEVGGMKTKTIYLANTGKTTMTTREKIYDSEQHAWKTTVQ